MKYTILFCIALSILAPAQHFIEHPEYKKFFDEGNVTGSFFMKRLDSDTIICFNKSEYHRGTLPASTFKICNSLIGLETGVITDENYVIPWDGVKRSFSAWNQDHTMATAFKNSVVPYYQELARRVGAKRMKYWIRKAAYGNMNIGGGIDQFWLRGKLRISPGQQLDFLQKLCHDNLPFSERNQEIVKRIMINGRTDAYTLHVKTGWAQTAAKDLGWWVGYIEMKSGIYLFATRIEAPLEKVPTFTANRITISRKIFSEYFGIPFDQSAEK